MEFIIQLIMKIFSEIQKNDLEKRNKNKKKASSVGGSLEDWLRGPPTRPGVNKKRKNKLPAEPVEATSVAAAEPVKVEAKELEKVVAKDAYDLNDIVETENSFELPGNSVLEKMMWAQVVMGPCKARQPHKSRI